MEQLACPENSLSQNPLYDLDRNNETKPNSKNVREIGTVDEVWHRFNQNLGDHTECQSFVKAFASTTETGKLLFVELPCRSWECARCGPKLRFDWYTKHMSLALDVAQLEQKIIEAHEWGAVRKALNRAKARYFTYDRADGKVLVITTGNIGGLKIGKSAAARKEAIVRAIESTPLKRQPISQSRNWTSIPPKSEEEEEPKKWRELDSCNVRSLEEVREILLEEGYKSFNYSLEKDMFGIEKGLVATIKPKDYYRILWRLGIANRSQNERRAFGGPPREAEAA